MHHSDIIVPVERQRQDFDEDQLTELGESILESGQIHPVIIDTSNVLIAGERRIRAIQKLEDENRHDGEVEVKIIDPVSDFHRHAIELEENIKRANLTQAEESVAIAEYLRLKQSELGTPKRHVGGGYSQKDAARELGLTQSQISDHVKVDKILTLAPDLAAEAKQNNYSRAAILAKFKQSQIVKIRAELGKRAKANTTTQSVDFVHHSNALDFLDTLHPESVDTFVTDIPFGMNVFDSIDLSNSTQTDQWEDDPEQVKTFVLNLVPKLYRALKDNTHSFISCAWHQAYYIHDCAEINGFYYSLPPLIWNRVKYTPARTKHMAFGKQYQFIVHLRKGSPQWPEDLFGDVLSFQRPMKPKYPSEMPLDLTRYLAKLACMPNELLVDPCCGSGSIGVGALLEGRRVLLNDVNQTAVDIARSRIAIECKGVLDANQAQSSNP